MITNVSCKVCEVDNQELRSEIETYLNGKGKTGIPAALLLAASKGVELSKYGLQKHRTEGHNLGNPSPMPTSPVDSARKGKKGVAANKVADELYLNKNARVEIGPDGGGQIETGETFEMSADWDRLLREFGVDPTKILVKGDTIRVSARTVRYKNDLGEELSRVARSYSAAFTPRPNNWLNDDYIDNLTKGLLNRGSKKSKAPKGNSTYLLCIADVQLGKSEGGGVDATIERYNKVMDAAVSNFIELRERGFKFEKIAIAQMGDLLEGCTGNYDSQLFTVELNQRRQLDLAIALMCASIDRMLEFGLPVHVISVNSNHGSWMRRGGRSNVTSTSDTSDGAVEDSLKRAFRKDSRVTFSDLQDQAIMTAELSGTKVGFSHGHLTSPAKSGKWLDDQDRVLSRLEDFQADVFVTAHSHHFRAVDQGAYMHYQCPALDGGSRWFQDMAGRWSKPGLLTMVLGDQYHTGTTEVKVMWASMPSDVNVKG
jgi:hypothetical protein